MATPTLAVIYTSMPDTTNGRANAAFTRARTPLNFERGPRPLGSARLASEALFSGSDVLWKSGG
jgi:hypothetical protein